MELSNEGDVTGYKLPELMEDLAREGFDINSVKYKHMIKVQQGRKKKDIEADAILFEPSGKRRALVVIETKPPEPFKKDDAAQAISYARLLDNVAPFAILTNGLEARAYDVLTKKQIPLTSVTPTAAKTRIDKMTTGSGLAKEAKHEVFKVDSVQEYKRILKSCHNTIRSNEGYDPTRAFDELSKVMFTKLYEERHHGERFSVKRFDEMLENDVNIIDVIFEQTKNDPDLGNLFDSDTKIDLKNRTVRKLVEEFQDYDLSLTEFDIKGEAFEHFLGDTFTGGLGQYFTPRNVVNFMIAAEEPKLEETVVDPFCGTGGFLIAWHRAVTEIIEGMPFSVDRKKKYGEELDENCIFGIDWNERTAQACRMNLSMHGNGRASDNVFKQSGFVDAQTSDFKRGRSNNEDRIIEETFDKCITNPPFGALETDTAILNNFDLGRGRSGIERAALAMERAIRLVKPGGNVAIVIMDGILANPSMRYVRDWIRKNVQVRGLVSLNPETFEGYGGRADTTVMFMRRREIPLTEVPVEEDKTFMAMCFNSGYAKNGAEIPGNDLIEILDDFRRWNRGEDLESQLTWTAHVEERLDPRFYWRPTTDLADMSELSTSIDESLEKIEKILVAGQNVKAGLASAPKLDAGSVAWYKLGDLVEEVLWRDTKIAIMPNEVYAPVGVRWWGEGAFAKEPKRGAEIKANYVAPVVPGALIYNRLFAFRASFAVVGEEVSGGVVSNEFPQFTVKDGLYDGPTLVRYLVHLLNSPVMTAEIDALSQGSTKTSRNRLVQKVFLGVEVPVPEYSDDLTELVTVMDEIQGYSRSIASLGGHATVLRDGIGALLPINVD